MEWVGDGAHSIVGSALTLGAASQARISPSSRTADQLSGAELDAYRTAESQAIVNDYIGLAVALAIVAAVVWKFRNRLKGERHEASAGLAGLDLLKPPRFGYGALCIFLYVSAEVSFGSIIGRRLSQEDQRNRKTLSGSAGGNGEGDRVGRTGNVRRLGSHVRSQLRRLTTGTLNQPRREITKTVAE